MPSGRKQVRNHCMPNEAKVQNRAAALGPGTRAFRLPGAGAASAAMETIAARKLFFQEVPHVPRGPRRC